MCAPERARDAACCCGSPDCRSAGLAVWRTPPHRGEGVVWPAGLAPSFSRACFGVASCGQLSYKKNGVSLSAGSERVRGVRARGVCRRDRAAVVDWLPVAGVHANPAWWAVLVCPCPARNDRECTPPRAFYPIAGPDRERESQIWEIADNTLLSKRNPSGMQAGCPMNPECRFYWASPTPSSAARSVALAARHATLTPMPRPARVPLITLPESPTCYGELPHCSPRQI